MEVQGGSEVAVEECVAEFLYARSGKLHAEQARKLAIEMGHPALQPIAAVAGNDLSQEFDETGAIGSDDGEYDYDEDDEGTASPDYHERYAAS